MQSIAGLLAKVVYVSWTKLFLFHCGMFEALKCINYSKCSAIYIYIYIGKYLKQNPCPTLFIRIPYLGKYYFIHLCSQTLTPSDSV